MRSAAFWAMSSLPEERLGADLCDPRGLPRRDRRAIIDSSEVGMAQLVVRRLDREVVMELRRRAARSGRSMEAEHREILRAALRPGRGAQSLKELLLLMPAAGQDPDFARVRGKSRRVRL